MDKTDLNWGIRLALDAIEPTINKMEEYYEHLDYLEMGASIPLDLSQSLHFISTKLKQLNHWLIRTNHLITIDLVDAWNLENNTEKELLVKKISSKIVASSKGLVEWERSVALMIPPPLTSEIFTLLKGATFSLQADLCTLFRDIRYVLDSDDIHGEMEIKSPFKHPKRLMKVNQMLQEFTLKVDKESKKGASFFNSRSKD